MSKLRLVMLVCTSSLIVLVQSCTYNSECSRPGYPGCCVYKECRRVSYSELDCSNYFGTHCSSDFSCTSGCCIDSICKPESDSQCIARKKRCYGNWECDSGCCKNKRCQDDSHCSVNTTSLSKNSDGHHSSGWCGLDFGTCYGLSWAIGILAGIIMSFICGLYARRRRRAMLSSNAGRIGCVPALVIVPIVQHDELQNEREHEANDQPPNDPPPSYEE